MAGGAQRQDSVRNGLERAAHELVTIHDAARPMVTVEMIERSIVKANEMGACIAAVPVIDTIKSAQNELVSSTVDRSSLYSVQTPQTFRTELIRSAYERAYADNFYATDDAALVEQLGGRVAIVQGSYDNIKVTTPSDLHFAQRKLSQQNFDSDPHGEVRTGIGFDVHAFANGREMWLGGVKIDYEKGLMGHSDADVVLHAICDALLGAAGLGDIGQHFPDNDAAYKDIPSLDLLSQVNNLLADRGWRVVNVDSVVICERPKIAPHVDKMRKLISHTLDTTPCRINIKGTTTENLGFTGRQEGIACQAIAVVSR